MTEESGGLGDSLARLPQRIASLLELLTTLDQRIITALDSVEDMRRSIAPLEGVGQSGDELVADIRATSARLEERVNRDLDELKTILLAKLGELDLGELSGRIDRLESAVLNIEKATVHLDQAFQGGLEILPDFVSKRLRSEGRKAGPSPTTE
jgi:predicted RecB family endonuclease